ALAGIAHAFPDVTLVVVHLRSIDMPIPDADRLLGQPRAVAAAQPPGAEADEWNSEAAGFDRLHATYHVSAGKGARLAIGTPDPGCVSLPQGVSHTGACGGLTTRTFVALSDFSSFISSSDS